jgi:PAS domain S-box-containing protein
MSTEILKPKQLSGTVSPGRESRRQHKIGARLTASFASIALLMILGDAVVLWQFSVLRSQVEHISQVDQKQVAILRTHTDLLTYWDQLDVLVARRNAGQLSAEAGPLSKVFLEDVERAEQALRNPDSNGQDSRLRAMLETVRGALPAQLDALCRLASAGDWDAVRLRLEHQAKALSLLTSRAVRDVDEEVTEQRAQTLSSIQRVQRGVFLLVTLTAVFTLLIAGTLGLAITRSITQPLARLVDGSTALARGEFEHQVTIRGDDELAHLGRVFNDTAGRLRDLYATLQSSEDRLQRVINTIPAHVWSAEPDGSVDFLSQRWTASTGLSVDHGLGWDWGSVVHPHDLARFVEEWHAALAAGKPMESEARLRGPGGEYRWWLIRNVPLHNERGNIVKWYGTSIDIEDRKLAEQALKRSEAYLAEAQRLSHSGSWAYNPGTRKTLYWSEELFRIFGLDPQRGIPDFDETRRLVHPDDRDRHSETCLKGFREKADFTTEFRTVLRDGTLKHLHVIWHAVLDKAGEVVEYVGTAADVTERKQAEEALRRSQAYLTEAQLLSHTGSFGWKPSTGEIQWSEESFRIFQYDPTTKPTVERVLERIHPEDRALTQQIIQRASQQEKDYEHQYRLLMPDGSVKYLHIMAHALRDESGSIEFVGAAMDVTAAKQAEERVRQSEAELRQLIDVLPQQVFVFDANWNPLFANQREREYTGLTLEEAQSKDALARIFHPDDLKKLEALRERMLSENVPSEMEARIRGRDGQYRWFLIRDNPLLDEQGRVFRWYGTRTDIEERKRAEEALRRAQTELAHVTRIMTMGELAASIAHEVNQPLSGVVVNANACLRWLAGDSPNLEESREAVRRIVRDGKRAGDVIARIRALATKTATAKERLDLNEAVREVVPFAGDQLRKNRVAVRTELAADLLPVSGDRVQLQQVILNLVMNGIEAMSSVEERPRELIVRTQNDEAGQVQVTVQDSGKGLDPQSMERMFEAFYTTKHGGMGMGLAISRSIIQNHGGKLWAVANEGPGVSVQFTIPNYQP